MQTLLMSLMPCFGCAQISAASVSDANTDRTELRFASGATLALPEAFTAIQKGNSFEFSIGNDPLVLRLFEFEMDLEAALKEAHNAIAPQDRREPFQKMNVPENGWDAVRIENYGPDQEQKWLLLMIGKKKGSFSWVAVLQGTDGIIEKRSSQALSLFGNLKVPGRQTLDLSREIPGSMQAKKHELEQFIESAMVQGQIPGLSIAIVEDGKLSYARGFGVAKLEGAPVNTETRFMVGSTSKSLTTFLISKLADEGVLTWDTKAVDLDPSFRLKDPQLTQDLKLLDLACACTGIPRHDLPMLLNHTGKKATDLIRELVDLEQTTAVRETFQYNNQLVAASGFLAAKAARPDLDADTAYHTLMGQYVFGPMHMHRTTSRFDKVLSEGNFAQGYRKNFHDTLEAIDFRFERFAEFISPSGGIWSTASDMAKYAITELTKGRTAEGQRIISEAGLMLRREPQVRISENLHYGLGWMLGKNTGLNVVQHGGATFGYNSEFVLFPDAKRAIIILSNSAYGNLIHGPIVSRILELWYEKNLQSDELLQAMLSSIAETTATRNAKIFNLTPDAMQAYLGDHFNAELGKVSITHAEGASYFVSFGNDTFALTGYREPSGNDQLMITELPLLGLLMEPIFDGKVSIKITRGQELYQFQSLSSFAKNRDDGENDLQI